MSTIEGLNRAIDLTHKLRIYEVPEEHRQWYMRAILEMRNALYAERSRVIGDDGSEAPFPNGSCRDSP